MKLFEAQVGRSATDADAGGGQYQKQGAAGPRLRPGKRRRKAAQGASANGAVAVAFPGDRSMLALEDSIEDCIYRARRMEMDSLADVVRLLAGS